MPNITMPSRVFTQLVLTTLKGPGKKDVYKRQACHQRLCGGRTVEGDTHHMVIRRKAGKVAGCAAACLLYTSLATKEKIDELLAQL